MKELILVLAGILIGRQLMAQTFSEWFRQNHTQLKYLAAQIAALRGYDGLLQKGYTIASGGLEDIGGIDEEDLGMHIDHIAELDIASPPVREDALVGAIRRYCALLPIVAGEIEWVSQHQPPSPQNWSTLGPAVAESLRVTAMTTGRWLDTLLSGNGYRIDDAGRIEALGRTDGELKHLYGKAVYLLAELDGSSLNPLI